MFIDRKDAGKQLASKLNFLKNSDAIAMAIPRGGVVVGFEVAKELDLELSLIIPRKIGAPNNPELALGAVAGRGATYLNDNLIRTLAVSSNYLKKEILNQVEEIKRRQDIYLPRKQKLDVRNRIVVVIDDGIATGATAIAALRALRQQNPQKIILAVPVAPIDSKKKMKTEADEVIVLETPAVFYAVSQFYNSFEQTTDKEVKELMSGNRR